MLKYFLGFMVLFLVLLIVMISLPTTEEVGMQPHPEVSSMWHSKQRQAPSNQTFWLGTAFGLGILGITAFFTFIGSRRKAVGFRKKTERWWYLTFVLFVLVFIKMILVDRAYAGGEISGYFWGFPLPTAWMLFALSLVPIIITIVYIIRFDRWIFSPDDQKKFEQIVSERAKRISQ